MRDPIGGTAKGSRESTSDAGHFLVFENDVAVEKLALRSKWW